MQTSHQGVIIGLVLLIGCLILCHMSRLLSFQPTKSSFNNISANPANRIIYQGSTQESKYCPGSHPNIPCDLVKNCPRTPASKLTKEQQELVTMYAYLSGLIESVDIYNFKPSQAWFS